MTDSDSTVRTYTCPSPDDCSLTAGGTAELLEHVNTEHAGEYRRDGWPDTSVGRASRLSDEDTEEDENEESRTAS